MGLGLDVSCGAKVACGGWVACLGHEHKVDQVLTKSLTLALTLALALALTPTLTLTLTRGLPESMTPMHLDARPAADDLSQAWDRQHVS